MRRAWAESTPCSRRGPAGKATASHRVCSASVSASNPSMTWGMTSTRHFNPAKSLVGVAAAAAPAAIAVALRNHYDWEETDAWLDLAAACGGAGVFAGAAGAFWERRPSATMVWALAGAGLVIPLLVLYYVVLMLTAADYS